MNNTRKSFEELSIIDDFMMSAAATDEQVGVPFCQTLLSVLLQREIGQLQIVAQRTIPALTPTMRGIRMDVEIEEFASLTTAPSITNIYDIEPHTRKDNGLLRRNRFYQAKIDSRYLKSGENNFTKLPNLYILMITDFDPFGQDYMMYTIQNKCLEVPELPYDDGLQFIYFYTKGTKGGNEDIRAMLHYIQNSCAQNATTDATRKIHNYISQIKIQPEVKLEYMKFDEIIQAEREDAAKISAENTAKLTLTQCILDLFSDCTIPETLLSKFSDADCATLQRWFKLAAKSASPEDFLKQLE